VSASNTAEGLLVVIRSKWSRKRGIEGVLSLFRDTGMVPEPATMAKMSSKWGIFA